MLPISILQASRDQSCRACLYRAPDRLFYNIILSASDQPFVFGLCEVCLQQLGYIAQIIISKQRRRNTDALPKSELSGDI